MSVKLETNRGPKASYRIVEPGQLGMCSVLLIDAGDLSIRIDFPTIEGIYAAMKKLEEEQSDAGWDDED